MKMKNMIHGALAALLATLFTAGPALAGNIVGDQTPVSQICVEDGTAGPCTVSVGAGVSTGTITLPKPKITGEGPDDDEPGEPGSGFGVGGGGGISSSPDFGGSFGVGDPSGGLNDGAGGGLSDTN